MAGSNELKLCLVADLREGHPRRADVPGRKPFCVYLVNGAVYVSDNACTHGNSSLGDEGELNGFAIMCTWHGGAFDIRTGEVIDPPCTMPLNVYPTSVLEGELWISLPD